MFRLLLGVTLVTVASCAVLFQHKCFSSSNMFGDFHTRHLYGTESMDVVNDPAGGSCHVLRVHYAAGSHSGTTDRDRGGGFFAAPISPQDSLTLSYDVYFANNFEWVKGGKLPGLWGGSSESCNGGQHSDDCFTTRFMWRSGGAGEVYAYITRDQDSNFCSRSDVYCNFDWGNDLGLGSWHFQKGRWQNIAQHVQLNTPGHHDGSITVFVDHHQVYRINNIALRSRSSVRINGFMFSTFFGGHDTSWSPSHDTYAYFKNFVLSTGSTPVGK